MGLCVLTWGAEKSAGGLPLPLTVLMSTGLMLASRTLLGGNPLGEFKSIIQSWYLWIGFLVAAIGLSLYSPMRVVSGGYEQLVNGGFELVDEQIVSGATRRMLVLLGMLGSSALISRWLSRSESRLCRASNCLIVSSVFVAAWGCAEVLFLMFGWPFPSEIFHNNPAASAQGYTSISAEWPNFRTASVALEPSLMAQFVMCGVCLALPGLFSNTEYKTIRFAVILLLLSGLFFRVHALATLALHLHLQ